VRSAASAAFADVDAAVVEWLPRRLLADMLVSAARKDAALLRELEEALRNHAPRRKRPVADPSAEAEPVGEDEFMIGASPVMLDVFEKLRRFATVDAPVLLCGESGTGKELAARAIHERSARATGPFVAINCAGLPPSLVSAELFGHERGAFTGAVERRIGHIEMARGGTLFLDEIGDLPFEIQGHLLRFLQDRHVIRVGGRESIAVDVRVIAATNVPLLAAIRERRFREDLYYRLAVLTLELPPLRARGSDIELLAHAFLRRIAGETKRGIEGFEPEALEAMRAYRWPGNVRQLVAVIRRAVVMANGPRIRLRDLALDPADAAANDAPPPARRGGRSPAVGSEEEKELLASALQQGNHCVAAAARILGVSRVTLYRMLRRNGIAPPRRTTGARA
jgi:DNA-binding NtrC family response regulator